MKSVFPLALVITFTALLSGCEKPEDEEVPAPVFTEVAIDQITQTTITPYIEVSGTIIASEEATIASEATGTVDTILVTEGDKVEAGQVIMNLEASTNLYQVSYSAAVDSFNNAKNALALTKESAAKDEKNAEIAVNQARIALDQAEISYNSATTNNSYTEQSVQAQINVAQAAYNVAQKDLEVAQVALTQAVENEAKTKENLLENAGIALSSAMVDFRSSMTYVDELFGISDENSTTNDSYGRYISAKNTQYISLVKTAWKPLNSVFIDQEEYFIDFSITPFAQSDETDMVNIMNEVIATAKDIRNVLRNAEEALKNSVTAADFSQDSLDTMKSTLRSYQVSLESNLSSLSSSQQALSDFEIQSPQRIINAELQVQIKESNLVSSEENLKQLQNTTGIESINSSSQAQTALKNLENAQQALESAQNTWSSTQAKNALSIQSAQSQYDSAKATMDQSLINLSKLTITAPYSGTITSISIDEGSSVAPGTALVVLSDFTSLKLDTDISVEESLKIQKDQEAIIALDEYSEPIIAKVTNVFPSADSITRRVPIEISFENTMNIPANIFARANINLSEKEVIQIPFSALISQSPPLIFIAEPNENTEDIPTFVLKTREIIVSQQYDDVVEIQEGVEEGEFFLTEKPLGIKEGEIVIQQ